MFDESFSRIDLQICRFDIARPKDYQRERRQNFCDEFHCTSPKNIEKRKVSFKADFPLFFIERFFTICRAAVEEAAEEGSRRPNNPAAVEEAASCGDVCVC